MSRGHLGCNSMVQESSRGDWNQGGGKGDGKNNIDSRLWFGLVGGLGMGEGGGKIIKQLSRLEWEAE